MDQFIPIISRQLKIPVEQVRGCTNLLTDGATIPFIARYRKEATGSLDEVAIESIRDLLEKLQEIEKRRQTILNKLCETERLTEPLKKQLQAATSLVELEDIYLPYRTRRQTRADRARDAGLEPLARALFADSPCRLDPSAFISDQHGITDREEALSGARDIMAQWISEHLPSRNGLRKLFHDRAILTAKPVRGREEAGPKYRDYFDWQEPVKKLAGHRYLAMIRGEREKILRLRIQPEREEAIRLLEQYHVQSPHNREEKRISIADAYSRLLAPALERELRNTLLERATQEALQVFRSNLKELLLAPPLGPKRVLALDPGFRTGAKLVCLDEQGNLLTWTTIYPTLGEKQATDAAKTVKALVREYQIEAIGIGNKTAGRETEQFIRSLDLPDLVIAMVNEDGASVYSASEVGRREFPELDLTIRGAISIGRRLQDPLAELVKIDPKSIGVGQYQHDLPLRQLEAALNDTVIQCVNQVGVDVNSASIELLSHVSGLNRRLAEAIVDTRRTSGPFQSRQDLLSVQGLGPKTFEQCCGFLRINGGLEPLDASGVHPESYPVVRRIAQDLGCEIKDLLGSKEKLSRLDRAPYPGDTIGHETLEDIIAELLRPGRDPRQEFTVFQFDDTIRDISDIREGMVLPAIVTNITNFGVFADIGIKENGLIHISQLANRYVRDPREVVHLGQKLTVRVISLDLARKRIGLSLRLT